MKRAIFTIAILGFGVVGCSSSKKMTYGTPDNSVTDVAAVAPAPAYQSSPMPAPQPVMYDNQPGMSGSGNAMGGSYTVKKGDTLYSIARQRYGDGKQWTKIASANPGLKPQSLRVGQSITLP